MNDKDSLKKPVRIELEGKDTEIFDRLFSKLTDTIIEATELIFKSETSPETKEIISDVTNISKTYFKAKLEKGSIENQKILAEIVEKYAAAEERLASAQKIRQETETVKVETALKKIEATIKTMELLERFEISKEKDTLQIYIKKDRKKIGN